MADSSIKGVLSEIVKSVTSSKEVLGDVKDDNKMVLELLEVINQKVNDLSNKLDAVLNGGIKKPKTNSNQVASKQSVVEDDDIDVEDETESVEVKSNIKPGKQTKAVSSKEESNETKADKTEAKPKNTKKPATKKPTTNKSKSSNANNSDDDEPTKVINNIMTYFKNKYTENQNSFDSILEENQAKSEFLKNAEELNTKKEGPQKIKAQATILYKSLNKSQKKKIRDMMAEENDTSNTNNDEDVEHADVSD
jgi:hypothetical protein